MTDATQSLREVIGRATAGPWEGFGEMIISTAPVETVGDGDVIGRAPELFMELSHEQWPHNFAAIVASIRLARFITGEGAEEALARALCKNDNSEPDVEFEGAPLWTVYQDEARAILEVLSRAALGEG